MTSANQKKGKSANRQTTAEPKEEEEDSGGDSHEENTGQLVPGTSQQATKSLESISQVPSVSGFSSQQMSELVDVVSHVISNILHKNLQICKTSCY